MFGLKLYINEFEEASVPQKITFKEYDKYLLINTDNLEHIKNILKSFQNEYDSPNYNLKSYKIGISEFKKNIIIKIDQEIDFLIIYLLILYIDSSAPQNTIYNVKGIFLNRQNRTKSYFVFFDTAFPLKLIGKTYKNKKMYVELDPEAGAKELIFLNSNIDYFKNFDFDKFENEIIRIRFKDIKIKPKV